MIYCIHQLPKVKQTSGELLSGLINISNLFGCVTFPFDHFLNMWDEQHDIELIDVVRSLGMQIILWRAAWKLQIAHLLGGAL
jgi:hypothetical protein